MKDKTELLDIYLQHGTMMRGWSFVALSHFFMARIKSDYCALNHNLFTMRWLRDRHTKRSGILSIILLDIN